MSFFALIPLAMRAPGSKYTEHLLCVDMGEVLLGPQRSWVQAGDSRGFQALAHVPPVSFSFRGDGGLGAQSPGCGLQVPMPVPGLPPLLVFNRKMGPRVLAHRTIGQVGGCPRGHSLSLPLSLPGPITEATHGQRGSDSIFLRRRLTGSQPISPPL